MYAVGVTQLLQLRDRHNTHAALLVHAEAVLEDAAWLTPIRWPARPAGLLVNRDRALLS